MSARKAAQLLLCGTKHVARGFSAAADAALEPQKKAGVQVRGCGEAQFDLLDSFARESGTTSLSVGRNFDEHARRMRSFPFRPGIRRAQTALDSLRRKLEQGPDLGDFVLGKELANSEEYAVDAPSWKEKKRKPDWMKRVRVSRTKDPIPWSL